MLLGETRSATNPKAVGFGWFVCFRVHLQCCVVKVCWDVCGNRISSNLKENRLACLFRLIWALLFSSVFIFLSLPNIGLCKVYGFSWFLQYMKGGVSASVSGEERMVGNSYGEEKAKVGNLFSLGKDKRWQFVW